MLSVAALVVTITILTVRVQNELNTFKRGFAPFFPRTTLTLAFAARALTWPAFSFTAWTLPRTSLRASSHFVHFLGLFFTENSSYFLLVFFTESIEFFTNPFAVTAFTGFSHQFAKGSTLFCLKFFHLLSLFFAKAKCLGDGCATIWSFTTFSALFGTLPLTGTAFSFVCQDGYG